MKPDNVIELPPNASSVPATRPLTGDTALLKSSAAPLTVAVLPESRSPSEGRLRKPLIFVIIVAVIVALAYGIASWILGPRIPASVAAKGNVVQTIVASGHVEAPLRIDIGSQIVGTVAAIPVAEGQTVKEGQLLISLEDSEAKALVANARAAVEQTQAKVNQIRQIALPSARQALQRTQINLVNLGKQLDRTKELQSKNLASQSQLDDAATAEQLAESDLHTAQLQVDTYSPGGTDAVMAQTALAQAQATLKASLAKLSYTTIAAPADGILIARNVERGDVVQPGAALMVLSPAGSTQLIVQIDEKNLSYMTVGQPVVASADAYPDQQFAARVAYINPGIDAQRGSVLVKLDVPNPPEYLRQDMTVSVEIEVARRVNAIVVSAEALHNGLGPDAWVYKIENGKVKQQPVVVGARGSGVVEVKQGLQEGDVVVASTIAAVVTGERVRAQASSDTLRTAK